MRAARDRARHGIEAFRDWFDRSPFGQAVISALVTTGLLIGIVWNMPDSEIKATLTPGLTPIATAVGFDQRWQMYAPDPIRRLEFLDVRVTMADGSERVWNLEQDNSVYGQFSWYHWQKLKEQAIRQPDMRAGLSRWVARKVAQPSGEAVRVRMIFLAQDLPAPGHTGLGPLTEEVLYDETLVDRTR